MCVVEMMISAHTMNNIIIMGTMYKSEEELITLYQSYIIYIFFLVFFTQYYMYKCSERQNKSLHFQMMVWLTTYYEFFNKKVHESSCS